MWAGGMAQVVVSASQVWNPEFKSPYPPPLPPQNYSTGFLKFKIIWFPWTVIEAEREKG
jgi:hypothetical protein